MKPTLEQIAQWKKEAHESEHYKIMYLYQEYSKADVWSHGYLIGRQAAFEEVARLQAEHSGRIKIDSDHIRKLENRTIELAAELERMTKERDELQKKFYNAISHEGI